MKFLKCSCLLLCLLLTVSFAGCNGETAHPKTESSYADPANGSQAVTDSTAPDADSDTTATSKDAAEASEDASEEASSEIETIDRANLPLLTYDILYDEDHLAPSVGMDRYLFDRQIQLGDSTYHTLEQSGYMEQEILCHLRVLITDEWLEQTFSEEDVQKRIDLMYALGIACEPHEDDTLVAYHGEFLYSDLERLAELGGYAFGFCWCEKGEGSLHFD